MCLDPDNFEMRWKIHKFFEFTIFLHFLEVHINYITCQNYTMHRYMSQSSINNLFSVKKVPPETFFSFSSENVFKYV